MLYVKLLCVKLLHAKLLYVKLLYVKSVRGATSAVGNFPPPSDALPALGASRFSRHDISTWYKTRPKPAWLYLMLFARTRPHARARMPAPD